MKNKLAELPKTNATVFPIMRATQTATYHNQESTKHKAKKQCRSDTESKLEKISLSVLFSFNALLLQLFFCLSFCSFRFNHFSPRVCVRTHEKGSGTIVWEEKIRRKIKRVFTYTLAVFLGRPRVSPQHGVTRSERIRVGWEDEDGRTRSMPQGSEKEREIDANCMNLGNPRLVICVGGS